MTPSFTDRLDATLVLTGGVGGASTFTVPAGNLKRLTADVTTHGFTATAEWWVVSKHSQSEDTLFSLFLGSEPLEAKLSLDRTFDTVGEEASPLVLKGLVTTRAVEERSFEDVTGAPVLQRRYRVAFADRGSVLWRQHHPTALYVGQSLKQLVEANLPDGVTVTFDGASFDTVHAVQSLALADEPGGASFLDYLHWVLAGSGGSLFCDPSGAQYEVRATKKSVDTVAAALPADDVAELEVLFPPPRREKAAVLNSFVDAAARKTDVDNADAAEGVRRDVLLTTPLTSEVDARVALEGQLLETPQAELRVAFARYPSVTVGPGKLFDFSAGWSTNTWQHGKTFRLYRLQLDARATSGDPTDSVDDASNDYLFELVASLEQQDDPVVRRPAFTVPRWPVRVEGKIVSELGEEPERTYQVRKDEQTSLEWYRVKVPLWDLELPVPFNPNLIPGHFYFPADKGARVLVSLGFRSAYLKRFLDWRPGAALPTETQGDHLIFGKKTDDGTSLRHVYEDGKPVLRIQRTSATDLQTITLSEGKLLIQVEQEEEQA